MPIFYSDNQTEFELTEPQLTRWRHRLRGPRESLKHNTQAMQIEYDLRTLYSDSAELRERMREGFELIEFGGSVDADILWDDDTPVEEPIELVGLEDLVAETQRLMLRIAAMEA